MGRHVLMLNYWKTIVVLILILCLPLPVRASDNGARSLHFVCSVDSSLASLSHADARKLFMGTPMFSNSTRILPVLNTSDPLVTEVFLQKIIFMSKRDYERQLVSRVYRLGGVRPSEISVLADLILALQTNAGAVSYMWSDQISSHDGIKSLGMIWSNSTD